MLGTCPWIDQNEPDTPEIPNIPCCQRHAARTRDRRPRGAGAGREGQRTDAREADDRRRALRQVLHQAALAASIHNKDLKLFADRLRKEGKPHKVVVAAVARKLVVIANALCKSRQPWAAQTG